MSLCASSKVCIGTCNAVAVAVGLVATIKITETDVGSLDDETEN